MHIIIAAISVNRSRRYLLAAKAHRICTQDVALIAALIMSEHISIEHDRLWEYAEVVF